MRRAIQGRNSVWDTKPKRVTEESSSDPLFQAITFPQEIPARADRMIEVVKRRMVLGNFSAMMSTTGFP